jgi:hypothetical protein
VEPRLRRDSFYIFSWRGPKRAAGDYARALMIAGGLIIGFTVVSAFSATRVYLSEQFPTALRGRGHLFGESCGKLFAGDLVPFFMALPGEAIIEHQHLISMRTATSGAARIGCRSRSPEY